MPVNTRLQIRRGTANSWTTTDPNVVLSAGEIGYETDTGRIKIGDGSTTWNSLDYNSVVPSGFLAGSGLNVSVAADGSTVTYSLSGSGTIQVSDITDFVDGVNDRVNDLLTAGSNIQLTYNDNNDDSSTLQIAVTGVAVSGHTHTSSDITDFNSSVSGLLPSVSGSGFVVTSFNNNVYNVSVTGVQPSGDYSLVGHTHTSSDITDFASASSGVIEDALSTSIVGQSGVSVVYNSGNDTLVISASGLNSSYISDFNSSVSGLLPTVANSGDNRILTSTGTTTGVNAETNLTFDGSLLSVSGNIIATSGNFANLTVNNIDVSVSGHNHILSDITDVTASSTEVNYLDLTTGAGTVDATKAVVVDSSKNITGFNNITASGLVSAGSISTTGNVTVGGDLTIQGTTTTVNSTTVDIGDNIITVNTSGLPEGGFRVFNGSIYKSLIWNNNNSRWEFSGPEIHTSGLVKANTFESTIAGPTAPIVVASTGLVTNLNSDLLDGEHGSYYLNYNNFSNTPTIGSGTLTLNVSGSGLTGSASFGANDTGNTTFTVTSNATSDNTVNTIVARDGSGNFTATNITASGFIGNGSSLTSLNASNLSSGTVASGLLPEVTVGSSSTGPTGSFVSSVSTDSKGRVTSVNTTTHTIATTGVQGIASFDSADFSVAAGVVTIKSSGVSNSQLENDRVTIGATPLVLGDTISAISGVSAASPVTLTYFVIDGGTP